MYFTARVPGEAEANNGGCVGFATSPDLVNWTLLPPVHAGGFGQIEVPQVFGHQGQWYCLFCTAGEHFSAELARTFPGGPVTGSHYLIGDGPRGPWRLAPGPFLDGAQPCERYAARMLKTETGLMIIGARYILPDGQFAGFLTDPDPVEQLTDGTLKVAQTSMAAE
jgi:beta-fructofuranosidase